MGATRDGLLDLRPVDPIYRATFADGSALRVRRGREAMADEIASVCGRREADRFAEFVVWLERLFDLEMPSFIDRNYDGVIDLVRPLRPAIELARLGGFRRLATTVERYFQDERLRRIFSFQALYAGLAPHQALSIYAVIAYMDTVEGVYAPVGGMSAVPRALARAAADAGVDFVFDAPVACVERGAQGRVGGVRLCDGTRFAADAVVSNVDPAHLYRHLLRGMRAPRIVRRGRYSPSALVWHVGSRGDLPPDSAHHNIHFGSAWRDAFGSLLRGRRMIDPSILVSVASLDDPTLAPPNRHGLYVLEPVPNLDGTVDWTHQRAHARRALAEHVGRLGYPVDQNDIETEILVDPADWRNAGLERGSPFSLSHRFMQTGPFRTPNVERRVPGLVLCGAGTVPGVGIPMALLSGRLAAQRVRRLRR